MSGGWNNVTKMRIDGINDEMARRFGFNNSPIQYFNMFYNTLI